MAVSVCGGKVSGGWEGRGQDGRGGGGGGRGRSDVSAKWRAIAYFCPLYSITGMSRLTAHHINSCTVNSMRK